MAVLGVNQSIPTATIIETLLWCENFSTVLTADPTLYGFNAAVALDVANTVADFRAQYDIAGVVGGTAVAPGTYTQPSRASLYTERDATLAIVRPMAVEIHVNPGIGDEDKLAIGVVPRNFSRTPIYVPATTPILGFQFASMGSHTLSFSDETTPSAKRKPFGAVGLQLFVGIGDIVTPLGDLLFYQLVTRNPAVVAFDPSDEGKVATYSARWQGKRGDVGPWAATINATIMFSQVV